MKGLRRKIVGGSLLALTREAWWPMASFAAGSSDVHPRILQLTFDPNRPTWLWRLPQELRVFEDPQSDMRSRLDAYVSARDQNIEVFRQGVHLIAMGIGPVLDAPDKVELLSTRSKAGVLTVTLSYTRVRLEGEELRQNLPWRPAIELELPRSLSLGTHEVRAAWRLSSHARVGVQLAPVDMEQIARFRIVAA